MSVTISPLTRDEIPTFVKIELAAFQNHPRIPMLWPRGYTADLYAYYEANKNESFDDSESRFVKAVDDATGDIVAVSQWTFSQNLGKQRERKPTNPDEQPPENWPIEGNWELKRFFKLNTEKWEKAWLEGEPYIGMLNIQIKLTFHC